MTNYLQLVPVQDVTTTFSPNDFCWVSRGGEFMWDTALAQNSTFMFDISGDYRGIGSQQVNFPGVYPDLSNQPDSGFQPSNGAVIVSDKQSQRFAYNTGGDTNHGHFNSMTFAGANLGPIFPLVGAYARQIWSWNGSFYMAVIQLTTQSGLLHPSLLIYAEGQQAPILTYNQVSGGISPYPEINISPGFMWGFEGGLIIDWNSTPDRIWFIANPYDLVIPGFPNSKSNYPLYNFGTPIATSFIEPNGYPPEQGLPLTSNWHSQMWRNNLCMHLVGGPGGSVISNVTGLCDNSETNPVNYHVAIGPSLLEPIFPTSFVLGGHSYAFGGSKGLMRFTTVIDDNLWACAVYNQKDGVGSASTILLQAGLLNSSTNMKWFVPVRVLNWNRSLIEGDPHWR